MNTIKKSITTGLLFWGLILAWPMTPISAAPPVQTEESPQDDDAKESDKGNLSEEEKKEKAGEKKLGATLSNLRKYLENEEKQLRVSGNIFSSKLNVSDCTSADKARARLDDVGDEGGIIVKEDLNIAAHNEANIEKNEGSITNVTEVNIINEVYKRC